MEEKIYTPSEELRDLMIQFQAEIVLRDSYIQLRHFGHKAASKAAFEAERCRNDFWRGIYAEFPELCGNKSLSYNIQENRLTAKVAVDG